MCQHVVIGNGTEVGKFVIVDVHGEAFFDGLLDEVVDYCIGLTTTWSAKNNSCTERIDHVNPALVPFLVPSTRLSISQHLPCNKSGLAS